MVGDVVGGYEVKEALGSGRTGLLFLAIQASGHRAVVRRRLGDDDPQEFAREVAQVLALTELPAVERRKSRAGVPVMIAIVDPHAPGSGYTDHTNTVPLPHVTPKSRPSNKRLPVVLIVVALLGLVGSIGLLSGRGRAPTEVHTAPVALAEVTPIVHAPLDEPVAATPALPVAEPVVADAGLQTKAVPFATPAKLTPRSPAVAPAIADACNPDDEWKKGRNADIQDLFVLANRTDALSVAWDRPLTSLEREVHRATNSTDCAAIEKTLQRYVKKLEVSAPP